MGLTSRSRPSVDIIVNRVCTLQSVCFRPSVIPVTTPPTADRESRRGGLLAGCRGVERHTRGAGGKRYLRVILEAQMQKTLPFAKLHCQLGRRNRFAWFEVLPDLYHRCHELKVCIAVERRRLTSISTMPSILSFPSVLWS